LDTLHEDAGAMTDIESLRPLDSAELFRLYARFVARLLYRLGVPAHMIDDVVQEVFIVVHQRGGYVPGPAKPTSYLAVIATHAASKLRRSERVRQGRASGRDPDDLIGGLAAPDHALDDRASLARVRAALGRMDPTLGTTLLLADGEEEPCASIAAAMSVPLGTVYWRLHRARSKFVSALKIVDAELARTPGANLRKLRESERDAEPPPQLALRRRVSMALLFGWPTSKFRETEAYALLRQTSQPASVPLDIADMLVRHVENIARGAPLPPWAAAGSAGYTLSLLKLGTWVSGAAFTLGALYMAALSPATAPGAAGPVPLNTRSERERSPAQARDVPAPMPDSPLAPAPSREIAPAPANDTQSALSSRQALPPAGRRAGGNVLAEVRARGPVRAAPGAALADVQHADQKTAEAPPEASPQAGARAVVRPIAPSLSAADELRLLAEAEALAEQKPRVALMLLERLQRGGASDYLDEEQQYITIVAKRAAGRVEEARADAAAFCRKYPKSGFTPRVRALLNGLSRD